MNLKDARVLLTGAAGGIGSVTAHALGRAGAKLLLTDMQAAALHDLAGSLRREGIEVETVAANVASPEDRAELVSRADALHINTVVNLAGVNPFGWLSDQTEAEIELVFRINTLAPVLLCQAMLPVLSANGPAHIVNVGSAFGAIGFPGFTAYSASKFAVRGFSEALRRELADTDVKVHYVAPRATRTKLVTDRVRAMNDALHVAMDPPETVAKAIVRALATERRELAVGFPERLFAKINGLLPAIVDRALAKQLPTIRHHATANAASAIGAARTPLQAHEPLQERSR